MVNASSRKSPFDTCAVKVLKGHTRDIRSLHHVKDIYRGYRLEMDRRAMKQAFKEKPKISRALKSKMPRNDHNKGKKYREKFGYKITNNSRKELLLDKNNGNTLWSEAIVKEMTELEKLSVFQLYPPKNNFEKKCGWKYAPMHMLFDVKQQDLQHKAMLIIGGHIIE